MNNLNKDEAVTVVPWKAYARATLESVTAFYIATFCLALFFRYHGLASLFATISMVLLYILVIGLLMQRVAKKFSLAALMLIIPIAPLLALIIIVTMLPIIERL